MPKKIIAKKGIKKIKSVTKTNIHKNSNHNLGSLLKNPSEAPIL